MFFLWRLSQRSQRCLGTFARTRMQLWVVVLTVSAPLADTPQMGIGRLEGTKLKTESDYQVRSISALTGTGFFFFTIGDLVTIHYLSQRYISGFHIRQRQR